MVNNNKNLKEMEISKPEHRGGLIIIIIIIDKSIAKVKKQKNFFFHEYT